MCWFYVLVILGASVLSVDPLTSNQNLTIDKPCLEVGDCANECTEKCGCDRFVVYRFNETSNECEIDVKLLMLIMVEKYNNEEKIRLEADRVFKGIIVSALIFLTCALICTVAACVYCCRIVVKDNTLKKDVKVIKQKLGRDKPRKSAAKPKIKPEAESCNVICEDAGVMCV